GGGRVQSGGVLGIELEIEGGDETQSRDASPLCAAVSRLEDAGTVGARVNGSDRLGVDCQRAVARRDQPGVGGAPTPAAVAALVDSTVRARVHRLRTLRIDRDAIRRSRIQPGPDAGPIRSAVRAPVDTAAVFPARYLIRLRGGVEDVAD